MDLVHVPTFAEQLALPGSRFAEVFTAGERRDVAARGGDSTREARHWAVRWAAREAVVKAWSASLHGTPPPYDDGVLRLIEVVCDAWDRPRIELHGVAAEALGGHGIHVSLSHDGDYATAFVVLSD